ncbi:D-alanyl-D-alanine carboxypeptidase family protein [Parafrigoribacterium soli]|uniref:D-alanyl-D-alanine carboxypeptidase family protein n=1 Tax=Parafrigoribacterium soli TaxID=3144663 RepID=UPI0032EC63CF
MTPDDSDDLARFSRMLASGNAAGGPPDARAVEDARRRRRRGRIAGLVVAIVIVAAIGAYIPATLLAPVDATTASTHPHEVATPAPATLALPHGSEVAVSITGGDDFQKLSGSKELLNTSGANSPLPIASISKLITSLVILDAKPLAMGRPGPTITFSKSDAKLYDKYYVQQASIEPMDAGTSMSEQDALETILVASACNYAEVLSTWAYGSQSRFLAAAKAWLAKNGLTGTRMVEPTGLDALNVSTPSDLIALGKIALANPVVAAIVGSASVTVPNVGFLSNNNRLVGSNGVTGIKTGTLAEAGGCLLFSAVVNADGIGQLTVIGVVLGAASHESINADVGSFIKSIKAGFHTINLTVGGDDYGTYTTPWNSKAKLLAGNSASVLVWSNTKVTSTIKTTTVTEARDGAKVGAVTFVAGSSTITVPLVLEGSISPPSAWWRLTHPLELLGN